jgi:hypothetical protein
LKPEDILDLVNAKVEEIKKKLPDKGRRLELTCIIVTEEQWDILFNASQKEDVDYDSDGNEYKFTEEEMAEENQPKFVMKEFNIGGIPVQKGKELDIKYSQTEKQRKYFRLKRTRKHDISKETI